MTRCIRIRTSPEGNLDIMLAGGIQSTLRDIRRMSLRCLQGLTRRNSEKADREMSGTFLSGFILLNQPRQLMTIILQLISFFINNVPYTNVQAVMCTNIVLSVTALMMKLSALSDPGKWEGLILKRSTIHHCYMIVTSCLETGVLPISLVYGTLTHSIMLV
jgi:hypothetical protein